MAAKEIRFGTSARERMMRGVDDLSNAVKITLGTRGRNVVLDKSFGAPRVTKDGVTVAKEIELTDKFDNWAPRWSSRSPSRPATSPAMAPPRRPCSRRWPRRCARSAMTA